MREDPPEGGTLPLKIQKTILDETRNVAVGTALLTAVMVLVFVLLKRFDGTVLAGAVVGWVAAVLDFFLLGITVQKAAELQAAHPIPAAPEQPEEEESRDEDTITGDDGRYTPADPETAKAVKRKVQLSYFARRGMLVCFAALGLTPLFNLVAVVLPMLFPKPVIMLRRLMLAHPKGGNNK